MIYVLIIVTNVHNGVVVSQQEYTNKDSCEIAATFVHQAFRDIKGSWSNRSDVQTRCVLKG